MLLISNLFPPRRGSLHSDRTRSHALRSRPACGRSEAIAISTSWAASPSLAMVLDPARLRRRYKIDRAAWLRMVADCSGKLSAMPVRSSERPRLAVPLDSLIAWVRGFVSRARRRGLSRSDRSCRARRGCGGQRDRSPAHAGSLRGRVRHVGAHGVGLARPALG